MVWLAMALPGFAQTPDPAAIRGRFAGTVSQKGVRAFKDQTFSYTLDLHITQLLEHEVSGTFWIPEVGCRGEIIFLHLEGGLFRFIGEPVKGSPKDCIAGVFTLKPVAGDKVEYAATFATPTNPRHPSLAGTLHRLLSLERREHVEQ